MLGRSRTWNWALCACRNCKMYADNKVYKRHFKRSARGRENRLWRWEAR